MEGGNPGGFASDPFAGCATSRVSGEMEGGQWSAADLWEGAHQLVGERLTELGVEKESKPRLLDLGGRVVLCSEPPVRTDEGETGAAAFRTPFTPKAPAPRLSRAEMVKRLVEEMDGRVRRLGCNREFDHVEYPELGHRAPKGEGGSNGLDDRALPCGPCNRRESNMLTGLQKRDRKGGFMAKSQRGKGSGRGQRRRLLGAPPRTGGEGNGRHRPATPPQGQRSLLPGTGGGCAISDGGVQRQARGVGAVRGKT